MFTAELKRKIMCLYPKLIYNPRYRPSKKNGWNPPPEPEDRRKLYIPIGCQVCSECRKKKSREWQVRLHEEIKNNKKAYFVTLTFKEEALQDLTKKAELQEPNIIGTLAVRLFLERWRKEHKKSVRHWLITELGHKKTKKNEKGTERLHLHGIIWTDIEVEQIEIQWKYGFVFIGEYVSAKTINYIIKYVTKVDEEHPEFIGKILNSPGIGSNYGKTYNCQKSWETDTYRLNNGAKTALPIYYRNHIFTEEERDELWTQKLDEQTRYINGQKIRVRNDEEETEFLQLQKEAQERDQRLGYPGPEDYRIKEYQEKLKILRNEKKNDKIQEKFGG